MLHVILKYWYCVYIYIRSRGAAVLEMYANHTFCEHTRTEVTHFTPTLITKQIHNATPWIVYYILYAISRLYNTYIAS